MSNPFYTFSPAFVPGSLARSGDVNTQFTLVQNAFDKVNSGQPGIGTDTGSVNAVVLTMSTTRTAYNNGDEFVFMAANQNTGATTIKVDGLGVIPLVRFNGTALQAGDLVAMSTWYSGRYSSASNSIEITSPAAYTGAAGIVSTAAPTHKVGLTAAGGTSINVLPVDATFAIDPAIAPTWTGAHTFNAGGTFNAGLAINAAARNSAAFSQVSQIYGNTTDNPTYSFLGSGTFTVGGNISAANFTGLAAPSGTIGLTAVSGSATTAARSDGTAALSQGIIPTWTGTHTFAAGPVINNAVVLNWKNSSGTVVQVLQLFSDNNVYLDNNASGALNFRTGAGLVRQTISQAGNVTINAPAGGVPLSITQTTASNAAMLQLTASGAGSGYISFTDGSSGGNRNWFLGTSLGGSNNFSLVDNTAGATRLTVGSAGNVTINAPSSGVALSVGGTYGGGTAPAAGAASAGGTGNFFGSYDGTHEALFGTSSTGGFTGSFSNHPFDIRTNNTQRVTVGAAGTVTINAPSSGNALQVNGLSGARPATFSGGTTTGSSFGLAINSGTNGSDDALIVQNVAGTRVLFEIRGDGVVFGNDGTSLFELGYKDTPLNSPGATYTLAASDRGKSIAPSSGGTITVPSGVFSGGAVVTIFIGNGGTTTIAQGSGLTLEWAGNGSASGNRTLTGAGIATVLFQSATVAFISGAGLS